MSFLDCVVTSLKSISNLTFSSCSRFFVSLIVVHFSSKFMISLEKKKNSCHSRSFNVYESSKIKKINLISIMSSRLVSFQSLTKSNSIFNSFEKNNSFAKSNIIFQSLTKNNSILNLFERNNSFAKINSILNSFERNNSFAKSNSII